MVFLLPAMGFGHGGFQKQHQLEFDIFWGRFSGQTFSTASTFISRVDVILPWQAKILFSRWA